MDSPRIPEGVERQGPEPWWRQASSTWWLRLLPVLGLWLLVLLASGFWKVDSFDYDEGINVMVARLLWQGSAHYQEIWNDQPPLLFTVLAPVTALDADRVVLPRVLISLFMLLMLLALQGLVGRGRFTVSTWLVVLWTYACLHVLQLSLSVMFGLPSLALALWSCREIYRYRDGGRWWCLILSAVAMAAAVLSKLWVAPCVLLALVAWLVPLADRQGRAREGPPPWREASVWLLLVGLVVALAAWYWSPGLWQQLIEPHIHARTGASDARLNVEALRSWLLFAPHLVPLFGTLILLRWQRVSVPWRTLTVPLCWFCGGLVIAGIHRPYWYHHTLFLTVPLLWGLGVLWEALRTQGSWPHGWSPKRRKTLSITVALVALLSWGWGVRAAVRDLRWHRKAPRHLVVTEMQRHAGAEGTVLGDRPLWIYRAGLHTPPYWALMSYKRISLPGHGFLAVSAWLAEHRPEQVLMARWRFPRKLQKWLNEHYVPVLVGQDHDIKLWVRPDLCPQPKP